MLQILQLLFLLTYLTFHLLLLSHFLLLQIPQLNL